MFIFLLYGFITTCNLKKRLIRAPSEIGSDFDKRSIYQPKPNKQTSLE